MYRGLQTNVGKAVNAQNTVKVEMKRGTFVNEVYDVSAKKTEIIKAVADANVMGLLTRDVNADDIMVALGYDVSYYDAIQDTVKVGEYAGIETIQKGERYATTEFDSGLSDTDAQEGKPLTVTNGILGKGTEGSAFISLGWKDDCGHKLLGFRLA